MATEIKTSLMIQAPIHKVWEVFTDFENYKNWNPFLTQVEGDVKQGNQISILAGKMSFKPLVLSFIPQKELVWKGKLFIPKLFDGTHQFYFRDNGDDTTTFIHQEKFEGILVPLFKKKIEMDTQADFQAMNQAFKNQVESLD